MSKLNKKISITFYQIVSVGFFVLSLFLYLSLVLYDKLKFVWASFLGNLETICGCPNHFTFLNHPYLFAALIIAGLGIATLIGNIVFKVVRININTKRFIKNLLANKKNNLSPKLKTVAELLKLKNKIIEIEDKNMQVFCYGYIKPKICITSGFVNTLSKTELRAVILHEQHHLKIYDPIKIFIINVLARALFFVPGLKIMSKKYFTLSELAADEWAIINSQDKTPLAQAIYKILEWKEKMAAPNNYGVPSFNNLTEERVNKIINDDYVIKIKILSPGFILGLTFLIAFMLSFGLFLYNTKTAIANHDNNFCRATHSDEHTDCEMINNDTECQMDNGFSLPEDNSDCAIDFQSKLYTSG